MDIFWRHGVAGFGEWVQVVYPIAALGSDDDPDVRINELAEKYEADRLGSGAGFGNRDIDYGFGDDFERARLFVEELRVTFPDASVVEES